ncbi:LCP family protein [Brevibacillus fluminis]|uniref:LCP family protein n=1 Tax=Brevibacillus fluminis TaxID=511487 RepID=UPI003F8C6A08
MRDSAARNRMPDPGRTPQRTTKAKPVKKKRNWKRFFTILFLFLLIVGGGAAGAVYWKVDNALNAASSSQTEDGVQTVDPNLSKEYHANEPISLLILGSDTRKETGSMNTDVMIVAVINPVNKKVTMLSIPRDTRIKIPGYRDYHKINSVYANGEAEKREAERNGQTPVVNGITLAKQTLSEVFGIPLQYYVSVDFDGFKAVVDEVGGVEVNVDRKLIYDDPTDDTHINLNPGQQLLNGEQALGYVRHRHDNRGTKYFSNDFDRNRRQQEVIKAIVNKMISLDGVTKIFNVIDIAGKHIHTDLPPDKIKGIVYDFKGIGASSITSLENDAFWSGNSGYTFFPKDTMDNIRTTLQTEMGIKPEDVGKLNNSIISNGSDDDVATTTTTRTVTKKKPVQKTAPAKQTKQEPAEAPKQETPPADMVTPEQQGGQTTPDPAVPAQPQGTGTAQGQPQPPADQQPPADMQQPQTQQPQTQTQPQQQTQPQSQTTPPPDMVPQTGTSTDSGNAQPPAENKSNKTGKS